MTTILSPLEIVQNGLPNFCGFESNIRSVTNHAEPVFLPLTNLKLDQVSAGFACALHMHQPTIPGGSQGELICNLQYMFEHPGEGDNHNAAAFAGCYGRMGDFIPQLVAAGSNPRIMLDYSGNLLWGLQQMGREDVLNSLEKITCDPQYFLHVEWLGTMWSHAVIPSTPIPDLKLQIQAWQQYFAALFGYEALRRVKGFSPPEMHLPNHPDTLFEYIKALKECGYRWLLVQEHSVEQLDGAPLNQESKYIPNRLIARNSLGASTTITVLVKTQGSDTKLVAQMQPYHEARSKSRIQLGNIEVPPCVTQIADGENGGVMMNEFPRDFSPLWPQIKQNGLTQLGVVGFNGTEYIELLEASGVSSEDYPPCQAVGQHKIWQRLDPAQVTPERLAQTLKALQTEDAQFHTEGASWTNDISWVAGYENVLDPMNQLSALFHRTFDPLVEQDPSTTRRSDYQTALLYVLLLETSCFRYWGQGTWTDYARELYQRGKAVLDQCR